jgi:ribosome maturation factor RimP
MVSRSGRRPLFLCEITVGGLVWKVPLSDLTQIEEVVEKTLRASLPDVDLLEVAVVRRDMLRLVIDHPDGVTHDLCSAVTHALDPTGLRERFGVEVWSPGPDRPLRTAAHYASAVGSKVTIKVAPTSPGGAQATVKGRLTAADETTLRVDRGTEVVAVPMGAVRRAYRQMEEESS